MPRQETRSSGGTSNRGFASMDAATQREIASKGGKAAHLSGNAHKFSSEEAREAGRKGGQAAHRSSSAANSRKATSKNVDLENELEDEDTGDDSDQLMLRGGKRAQPGDQSGDSGYGEAPNEARAQGRNRGNNQGDGNVQDYQAENQGRNQGRNNIGHDQERAKRSSQGRSHGQGGDA